MSAVGTGEELLREPRVPLIGALSPYFLPPWAESMAAGGAAGTYGKKRLGRIRKINEKVESEKNAGASQPPRM